MELFHWHSEALQQYSQGDIIVMAETVDEARQKARAHADIYLLDEQEWMFNRNGDIDEWCRDDYLRFIEKLEADLTRDPKTPNHPIFIRGGE